MRRWSSGLRVVKLAEKRCTTKPPIHAQWNEGVIGNEGCQETGRWLNNRVENSHQPFRRREGAMARFRDIKTLQKFTSVHASIHNHFNHQRHLNRRDIFKQGRAAALAEWRQLAV